MSNSAIDDIMSILNSAECKVIDDYKCFVVSLADFYTVQGLMTVTGMTLRMADGLQRKYGLVNLEFRMSPLEKGVYFICAKSEPVLDQLWAKNFKE